MDSRGYFGIYSKMIGNKGAAMFGLFHCTASGLDCDIKLFWTTVRNDMTSSVVQVYTV